MSDSPYFAHHVSDHQSEAMLDAPVMLIHGPRQCDKTTLANQLATDHGYDYLSFDDEGVLSASREDPLCFVSELPDEIILVEVQRVPKLFSSLKRAIDQNH